MSGYGDWETAPRLTMESLLKLRDKLTAQYQAETPLEQFERETSSLLVKKPEPAP